MVGSPTKGGESHDSIRSIVFNDIVFRTDGTRRDQ